MLRRLWQATRHYRAWKAWTVTKSCCSCDPELVLNPTSYISLKSFHLVAMFVLAFAPWSDSICSNCFSMEVRYKILVWEEHVMSSANTRKCSSSGLLMAATGLQLCDVQFMQAYVQYYWCSSLRLQTLCVEVCVSCWKPRLPCPCDPYVHCQRPCQGSGPYQFACSPHWLSLPDEGGEERRKEEGGECCLFVCLPALFYLRFLLITVETGLEVWQCCAGHTGLLIQQWKRHIFCKAENGGTQALSWNEVTVLNAVPCLLLIKRNTICDQLYLRILKPCSALFLLLARMC